MKQRDKITITQTDIPGYAFDVAMPSVKRDGALTFRAGIWLLDIFDSRIPRNHDKAHLGSEPMGGGETNGPDWNEVFNTMEEA